MIFLILMNVAGDWTDKQQGAKLCPLINFFCTLRYQYQECKVSFSQYHEIQSLAFYVPDVRYFVARFSWILLP